MVIHNKIEPVLVQVYTCQNVKLMEISYRGSLIWPGKATSTDYRPVYGTKGKVH